MSNKIQDDVYFIKFAVKQNGSSLEYASLKMQDNPYIAKEAIKSTARAYFHISPRLKNSLAFIKLTLKRDGSFLEDFKVDSVNNKAFNNKTFLAHEKELIEIAVKSNGIAIQFVNKEHKTIHLSKLALESNNEAIRFIRYSKDLLPTIFKTCFTYDFLFYFPDKTLLENNILKDLKESLKKEPQTFFLETFENIKENDVFTKIKVTENMPYFDLMFDMCSKETLMTMKKNNISNKSFMNKILNEFLLKKDVSIINMKKTTVKKERKLSY